ncbi:MAG TPA: ArsA family ATPase [Gordonia sp. (in: high G+C Gram-positive bacteria)]|uniref:ArsA family ATPase n=1 Tax=Gordonia sp. (in: high G+C Gram-positive bacteria) TaxID=84139 RepID=UPI000FB6264C|nr:ArsA family ATPase [Gordonia sp. (in: high G+C Gram-positive bacteria)]RUP38255.1 MAG: ArsA family ATPase [Gordonia sp. (in: high G+C Gram-positive bacteria)]HNP58306.1 ArsA family ATPase [Gordonia sp. (in: high G+C Gram-positive bacteria)]HRC51129.1 ArsA family ATPase [Gordonia sp. (in: high G+C Gram-positive bacteria)]
MSAVAAAGAVDRRRGAGRTAGLLGPDSRSTLLVTIDRDSPVPDVVGVYPAPGKAIPISADASLLALDPLGVTESAWGVFVDAVSSAGVGPTLPVLSVLTSVAPGELTALPGFEELLLWRRIRDEATSGRWGSIVVDCSGYGDPFALVRAPAVLSQIINRLWPRHRRLAAAAERPILAQVSTAVDELDRDCRDVRDLLSDPATTAAHLVVDTGLRGQRQLPRYAALAALSALPVRSVYGNDGTARLPEPGFAELASAVADGFGARTVAVGAAPETLDRVARLRRLGVSFDSPGGNPVGTADTQVSRIAGSGLDALYEMRWHQPLPDPARFGLGRAGDDLLVTISGFRFPVRLPSVLRRCKVAGADWDDDEVRIRFTPDPAVWPERPTA